LGKENPHGERMSITVTSFNPEKLALIKGMFCKDATDMEFQLFINMAERLQLDPVIKQIYFVKFSGKMSIIVGIDGYRLIADRTGKYMPGKEPSFTYDKEGKLFSATSYVKKLGPDGQWHEFAASAIRAEYDSGVNQWKKGPHYMLAKCAESLALRKGWPAEFSGTHTEEEMEKAIIDVESAKPITKPIETGSKSVAEPEEPLMGMGQDIEFMNLVGDDIEYRNRIFAGYAKVLGKEVKSFLDIPAKHYDKIKEAVVAYAEGK
jgi:phage recombination protein Bet